MQVIVNAHRCCIANDTGHQEAGVRIAKGDPHPPSLARAVFQRRHEDGSDCYSCGIAEMPHVPGCLRGARHRNWNFPGRGNLHTVFAHWRVRNIVDIFHPQRCTPQTKLLISTYIVKPLRNLGSLPKLFWTICRNPVRPFVNIVKARQPASDWL